MQSLFYFVILLSVFQCTIFIADKLHFICRLELFCILHTAKFMQIYAHGHSLKKHSIF